MIFLPDYLLKTCLELTDEFLDQNGIKGIVFDIDNTLVSYKTPDPTREILDLLSHLKARGLKLAIASNNKKSRVRRFAQDLGMDAYHRSAKPLPFRLRQILRDFDLSGKEVALVGDQIFTDVWGGNWAGMQTVLVEPIELADENFFFRVKRAMERPFLEKKRRMLK